MLRQSVLDALEYELEATNKPIRVKAAKVKTLGKLVEVSLELDADGIDDTLEEALAWWGPGQQASILCVESDPPKLTLRHMTGPMPLQGSSLHIYKPKYLKRLHDLWEHPGKSAAALDVLERLRNGTHPQRAGTDNLGDGLRQKQREALRLRDQSVGFLWGPPGTGKTFTVGALISCILMERPKKRMLLLSTTNRAVDEALISVDERLKSLRLRSALSEPIRMRIKRYGSNFDAIRYERESRQHLVADPHKRALISEIARLEHERPDKTDSLGYAKWKERLEVLRQQIPKPDLRAPLLAMTTTAAAYAFQHLEEAPFDYVVFDEASQINLPYACMLGTLGRRLLFAGDHKQLAPIVVSRHPTSQTILRPSPFEYMNSGNSCQLDEQDRMAPEICHLVADLFYEGNLSVVEASRSNREWIAERRVARISSAGSRRLYVAHCKTSGGFATQHGVAGVFRSESAKCAVELAKECAAMQLGDIVIITPYRKQRTDIARLLRAEKLDAVKVATVHSVQGAQFHTVIFDPVLGEPVRHDGKLLTDEREASRLINVALSRAKARFILLLSESDKSNHLLRQLADAIDMEEVDLSEAEPISSLICEDRFPTAFIGRPVRQGDVVGKLVPSEGTKYFTILTRAGERKRFVIETAKGISGDWLSARSTQPSEVKQHSTRTIRLL